MRHFLLTGFAGILVFAATGCGGEGGEQASTPAPTSPAATPAPSPAQTATPTPGAKAPDFQPPMVPATPAKPPGLISSTPTGQRTKEVKTGRPNPFGGLPLPPVLKIEGEENTTAVAKPPELGGSKVPELPELPVAIGPSFPSGGQTGSLGGRQVSGLPNLPGGIGPALPPGGRAGTGIPPQGGRSVPSLPDLPDRIGPQRPNLPGGRGGQSPNLPGGRGGQAGRQQPLPPPKPAVLEARAVPKLPELPGSLGPQIPPAVRARQGVQATPLGNKGIPKLPEAPPGIGPNLPPAAKGGGGVQVPSLPSQGVPKLPDLPVAIGPGLPPEPAAPAPSGQQPNGQQPNGQQPNGQQPNGQQPNGQQPAAAPEPPPLPPVPQPDVARAVEVSGVVQVGNETQIIVKAPNEPTSRYVKVGQRLANGTVLVKRVELNGGSEPVVILEENGIEVAKAVGEKPVSPERPNPSATS